MKLAFIDIDETLTPKGVNSWVETTKAVDGSVDELLSSLGRLLSGEITTEESIGEVVSNWTRKGRATREVIEQAAKDIELVDDAQDFTQGLRELGYEPILLTGSMNVYAGVIASRLGVETYLFNSELTFDEEGNLAHMTYDPDQAIKKLEQAKRLAEQRGVKQEDCIAVGDGSNDIKLFEWVGRGFAVASEEERLIKVATHSVKSLSSIITELLRPH